MFDGEDKDFLGDIELISSELVTNAIRHEMRHGPAARNVAPGIWMGVVAAERYCHLLVRDPYPVPLVPRRAAEDDENGRGLFIVKTLATAHWTEMRTYDKTVHAVIARPGIELTVTELDRLRR